jgi:hypothetical protein
MLDRPDVGNSIGAMVGYKTPEYGNVNVLFAA